MARVCIEPRSLAKRVALKTATRTFILPTFDFNDFANQRPYSPPPARMHDT